jgi:hypothetical protein
MKAIHDGKAKSDKIDAEKIARLLRGGNLPVAYAYPRAMRAARDLLRRRTFLVRQRAHLLAHVVNTNSQYNLPPLPKKLCYAANRAELDVPSRFADPSVRKAVEADLALVDACDEQVRGLELYLTHTAKVDDPQAYQRLRSVPGVAPALALLNPNAAGIDVHSDMHMVCVPAPSAVPPASSEDGGLPANVRRSGANSSWCAVAAVADLPRAGRGRVRPGPPAFGPALRGGPTRAGG